MKHLVLLSIFAVGCAQIGPSYSEENLLGSELENQYENQAVTEPMDFGPSVDYEETPPELILPYEEACTCEWEMWNDRGLLCLGVVCSDMCSDEIAACREVRHACVLQ